MVPRRLDSTITFIGGVNEVSAHAPSGQISSATGSFDSVTGATSLSSPIGNTGAAVANAYTLQLNTDFFVSPACSGSPNANCRGWEQFVYFSDGTSALLFIQYWLIQYNATCPSGWNQFSFSGGSTDIYCWRNAPNAISVPVQAVGNLSQMSLTGNAAAGADSIVLGVGATASSATGNNSVSASGGWTTAEFNVFGAGGNNAGGGDAAFNAGTSIVVRTRITYGGTQAPTCVAGGFTGETNNLNLGPNPPATTPPGPAVAFTESSAGGAVTACAAAMTIGDTHLATVAGLLYDFQAAGDFLLAEVGKNFSLQARQVSGAPTWPDATVNQAVALTTGKTNIAVCLGPEGRDDRIALFVDGQKTPLADGASIGTSNAAVQRTGNVFLVRDSQGNIVRADVFPQGKGWINVQLGLGRWPANVRGLLANARGDRNALQGRDGKVYRNPFSFGEFYERYGNSWRLRASESKLSVCGEAPKYSTPSKPIRARDLRDDIKQQAIKACNEVGMKEGPLFDACVLDTVVIGREDAARVFAIMRRPAAVGRFR
jgi:hypothetical protein